MVTNFHKGSQQSPPPGINILCCSLHIAPGLVSMPIEYIRDSILLLKLGYEGTRIPSWLLSFLGHLLWRKPAAMEGPTVSKEVTPVNNLVEELGSGYSSRLWALRWLTAAPASSLTATSEQPLSQNHPAKSLPDPWQLWDNKCLLF